MKKTCSICKSELDMGITRIVQVKGKDWVCRECLKKANISVMSASGKTASEISALVPLQSENNNKYCSNCGSQLNGANFCPQCGAAIYAATEMKSNQISTPMASNYDVNMPQKNKSMGETIKKGLAISAIVLVLFFGIIVALALLLPENGQPNLESEQTNTESEIILKPSPIAFINRTYEIDYVGGVQWTFEIKNNSEKEIKYVTLEWSCCDSVGEPIYDDITGKNIVGYKFPGPWECGETKRYQTDNTSKFYNHAYAQSKLVTIKVEFMDGEIVDINSKEYTDIFKTTSLNIPTLPYTVNKDADQPCCTITKIEYEFFDYTTYHTDGKFITNDFEISIYGEYDEEFAPDQYQLIGKLINSKGETILDFIVDFDYSGRYHKRALDSIDPGETYTLEFCYESK